MATDGASTFLLWATVFAACAVFLLVFGPPVIRTLRTSPWAASAVVAIAAICIDYKGALVDGGLLRYAGLAAVVVAVSALPRAKAASPANAVRWVAFALFVYAVGGTLVGRYLYGVSDGAFPIALPLLALIQRPRAGSDDEGAVTSALRVIAWLCVAFAALMLAARQGTLPDNALQVFNHEKAFLLVLGFGAALALRSIPLFALLAVLTGYTFIAYPAATIVLAFAVGIGTYLATLVPWSTGFRLLGALGAGAGLLWAVLHVDQLVGDAATYFQAVGKVDNGSTRLLFYQTALHNIDAHPWTGDYFTGNLSIVTTFSGQTGAVVPVHNDYLSLALGGGVLAVALMLALLALLNGIAIRALRRARGLDRQRAAAAIVALLAAVNAGAVTAFANPVFLNPGTSTAYWAISAALVGLAVAELKISQPTEVEPARSPVRRPGRTRTACC